MSAPSRGGFFVVLSVALALLSPDDACMDDAGDEDVPPSNNVAISIPRYGRAIISTLESASATRRTVLIGIANPIPSAS